MNKIQKNKKYRTFNEYDHCKVLYHRMVQRGWMDVFSIFMGSNADYLDPAFDAEVVLSNLHTFVGGLDLNVSKTIDADFLKLVFVEGIKYSAG